MYWKRFFIWIGLLVTLEVSAQIVDDSTELVYGPATISVIRERDLKLNTTDPTAIDTLLDHLESFSYVDRYGHRYQDLGNIGTAMFPVFYDVPEVIGRTSGYNAYNVYNVDPDQFRYFDTKSPHMDLRVTLGGQGRHVIDYLFTQNINPNWNFGFNIHKMNIDKQIGATQSEGDRNVEHTRYDLFTFYDHPEIPYRMLGYVSSFSHKVDETGGISVEEGASNADIFLYRDSRIKLEDAQAFDRRLDLHLYHEYGLFQQFQLYHQLDRNTQKVNYQDFVDRSTGQELVSYQSYYPDYFIDADSTYQEAGFNSLSNEVGLKGTLSLVYYRFYIKNRQVNQEFLYFDSFSPTSENYLGGITQFKWRDLFAVRGELELLQSGEFRLAGYLESDLINLSYTTIRYRQSNLVRDYFGNHYEWHNNFGQGFANVLTGSIRFEKGGLELMPSVELKTYDDFVYFDTLSVPRQAGDPALITKMGGHINYFLPTSRERGSGFHFDNEGYFTKVTGNSAPLIRIPELFYNGRLYWSGNWFQRTVPVQVGFNFHATSAYFANAFNPAIQQFHLQDDDELKAYLAIDAFWSMRVDKLFVFLKLTHANMQAENGYFVTPGYTGQERTLDFGVRWLFFD